MVVETKEAKEEEEGRVISVRLQLVCGINNFIQQEDPCLCDREGWREGGMGGKGGGGEREGGRREVREVGR